MTTWLTRGLLIGIVIVACAGCAHHHYKETATGTLKGKVTVEWYKPNLFVYRPDPANPLSFTRQGKTTAIVPGLMYTDGGSIPRPLWALRNYSPWGYGPAFIAHDWLFHMQNCKLDGYKEYTIHDAAVVMSEVMKTLMESPGFDYGSKSSVYLMYEAVQTAPAVKSWETGRCINPAEEAAVVQNRAPDATVVVTAP